ncbi:bifunctional enoyl-CoA hydratase/phosphate acetyltransferase [Novosphingobium nitrogenifigens DSM 19370]|uniref:Bifunctional enoyl-CoA hydratase/phosphate acetyltransferase n=1 Tax=Novosphingobium nitrogenifigens DSM 19370 TaxID=983920 RepID=F1Z4B4_9SPHN|nr:bifunctional enoyl-CoA hydratase/phosphate acetyltransferase [Novosphingobium nitrogenifigens]EGD60524.1 bifunctional enoyl-CoA hydratase/phosphate acetyltransferase [Novosphingobium nitrogenifigens DSM 19370]
MAELIENRTFAEIAMGDSASLSRTVTKDDITLFATVSGDVNPAHLDPEFAAQDMFHHVIVHGMWGAGLISAVLGTRLPGPGTIYLSQSLKFIAPVNIGDTITATVTVSERDEARRRLTLACQCTNQDGKPVIVGDAHVIAPDEKVSRPRVVLPQVHITENPCHERLLAMAKGGTPVPTAVVHPCSPAAIEAAVEAAEAGFIAPWLVGPEARIRAAAEEAGRDITPFRLIPAEHSHAASAQAVALAQQGTVAMLMKGSLHTDELMGAVVAHDSGLRTGRRISHVYVMQLDGRETPLLITDAAINIDPTLEDKHDIICNAIDLAHVLGLPQPKVAILAAVETVNPAMRATMDAAALCKMADRGQITGAILDGPLAFDNAVSAEAAREKGIVSPVAGQADILVVPNLEAGNMLAKQLTFMGGADAAGVVLGARVPIILTSRADSLRTRAASSAVAVLLARSRAAKGGTQGGAGQ